MASPPPKPPKYNAGFTRQVAMAMELPFILAGGAIVGGLIGYFLDRSFHTKPYLMLLLGGLGFIAGVRDMLKRLGKDDPNGTGRSGE